MENKYQVINRETWKRNLHCQIFENSLEPQYCISLELDITNYLRMVKERGYSFTFAFIYAVCKCANEIEEFRYRFLDGNVVLYEKIHTSFTYLDKTTELFKFVSVPMTENLESYIEAAKEKVNRQTAYFEAPPANDEFSFSPLPWISYTHISHTISGKLGNATPLFDWGKFFERDGRVILPFSVQVHHSFVDGIHVGKLVERLQRYLNAYQNRPLPNSIGEQPAL